MSKRDKLVDKFINDPASVKLPQILLILEHFGFKLVQAKGSHIKLKHLQIHNDLIIPVHNGDCKDFYKTEAKKYIQKLKKSK